MLKNKLKDYVISQLEEMKINDIIYIDTSKISSLASHVIIGSGSSGKQIESTMENLKINLKKSGESGGMIAGEGNDGWIVYDLGDIIIHLFTPDIRKKYKLEQLFNSISLKQEKEKVKKKNNIKQDKKSSISDKKVLLSKNKSEKSSLKKIIKKETKVKKPTIKKTVNKKASVNKKATAKQEKSKVSSKIVSKKVVKK